MDDQRRRDQGMSVRRAVLGDPHVDQAAAATTGFTADFQDLITRAMLAALSHDEELAMHVRAALRNGLDAAEINEVLLQVAVYAGVPAANRAFRVAQRVLGSEVPGWPPGQ